MSLQKLGIKVAKIAHKKSGTTVVLIGPDGVPQTYDDCIFLSGRTQESPDSGEPTVVFNPMASFPRGSLVRIPKDGEKWSLTAPLDPDIPDVVTTMSMDQSKAVEGGRSLGIIRIYLSQVKQL